MRKRNRTSELSLRVWRISRFGALFALAKSGLAHFAHFRLLSFAFACFRLLSLAFVLLLIICNITHTALATERTCGNLLHKRQRNRKLGLEGRFAGIKHIFKPGPVKPSTSRFVSWPIKPPSFY